MKKKAATHGFIVILFVLIMITNISGCGLLNSDSDVKPEFRVTIDNYQITQDEPFSVNLRVRNPSSKKMSIRTSCEEFANPFIYINDEMIDFISDAPGCSRMENTYELYPFEELNIGWSFEATKLSWNPDTMSTDTTSALPGEYVIQVRINATSVNDQDFRADHIESMLIVR